MMVDKRQTSATDRYWRIFVARCRLSLTLAAQYRWDFLADGALSFLGLIAGLLPLFVAFEHRTSVRGWSYGEVLLVVGFFTILKAIFSAILLPSLTELAAGVRSGTLDFLLTKPADAQFLVSIARFEFWRLSSLLWGISLCGYAFFRIGRVPGGVDILLALLLLVCGAAVLYSICIFVASLAFVIVKMDSLPFIFSSFLDFARWPASIFRGVVHLIFTVVFPVAILTTYPAEAALGRISLSSLAWGIAWSGALLLLSRLAFRVAVRRYTSASS
ncbi:MAG: ABC-2 family transporter protein [Myxococcales bacterium]|nr:ABC-2 family transporter protein [Myxococcales bacterium]